MDNDILTDLIDLGNMCKSCLLDLDSDTEHLKIRYIKLDDDIFDIWDNTKESKFVQFAYNVIVKLLSNKYKSDNLSIFYSNKRLKLVYIVNNAKYTITIV